MENVQPQVHLFIAVGVCMEGWDHKRSKTCSLQDDMVLWNGEAQTAGAVSPKKPKLKEPELEEEHIQQPQRLLT